MLAVFDPSAGDESCIQLVINRWHLDFDCIFWLLAARLLLQVLSEQLLSGGLQPAVHTVVVWQHTAKCLTCLRAVVVRPKLNLRQHCASRARQEKKRKDKTRQEKTGKEKARKQKKRKLDLQQNCASTTGLWCMSKV